jgi:hypothetical protein
MVGTLEAATVQSMHNFKMEEICPTICCEEFSHSLILRFSSMRPSNTQMRCRYTEGCVMNCNPIHTGP